MLVPAIERGAAAPQQTDRVLEDLFEDHPRLRLRREHGRGAVEREEPLRFALARLVEARRLDRDAQLPRDRLDEAHLFRGPVPRPADLRERECPREIAADPDRRRDGGAHVPADEVRADVGVGEPPILARVAHHDRAAEADRQPRDRDLARARRQRGHVLLGPLVRHAEVVLRFAERHDRPRHAERPCELLDRATQDLVRVEARPSPLGHAVHDGLAVGARLGFRDRQRAVDRARDVLAHRHRALEPVRDERPRLVAAQEERANETVA